MPHIAIYTLSLHDALPIYAELVEAGQGPLPGIKGSLQQPGRGVVLREDAVIIFGYRERKTPVLDFHAGIDSRRSVVAELGILHEVGAAQEVADPAVEPQLDVGAQFELDYPVVEDLPVARPRHRTVELEPHPGIGREVELLLQPEARPDPDVEQGSDDFRVREYRDRDAEALGEETETSHRHFPDAAHTRVE